MKFQTKPPPDSGDHTQAELQARQVDVNPPPGCFSTTACPTGAPVTSGNTYIASVNIQFADLCLSVLLAKNLSHSCNTFCFLRFPIC